MKPASEIISRPILTEKASGLAEANKYVFEVLPGADRAHSDPRRGDLRRRHASGSTS